MSARALDPSFRHALKVWWAFTWRWPVLMFLPLLPLAAALFFIKPKPDTAMDIIVLAGWPALVWAQVDALRRLMRLDFADFSLRLLERRPHE